MEDKRIKIFYSWQSDLPNSTTRGLIQNGIDDAVKALRDTILIEADRDTKGMYGSPDIVDAIFSKIDDCDVFVADLSIVTSYHPLDGAGESKDRLKATPNPNVMMELGYASEVVGWENVICIMNDDYYSGGEVPFDIDHRRLLKFSLKDREKKEVREEIRDIVEGTVKNILENGRRVKRGFSNIQVGSYYEETDEVSKSLLPFDIRNSSSFVHLIQKYTEEAAVLIEDIRNIDLPLPESEEIVHDTVEEHEEENKEQIITGDGTVVRPLSKDFQISLFAPKPSTVTSEEQQYIVDMAKQELNIDINNRDGFFNLGNLKQTFSIGLDSYSYDGTEKEEEKHTKIYELSYVLSQLDLYRKYASTFDDMLIFPLAVKNDSALTDSDITISIELNAGVAEVIYPSGSLIADSLQGGCEGLVYEEGIVKELLLMKESVKIKYDTDISYSFEDDLPSIEGLRGINGTPRYNEEDYEREISKYIASPISESGEFLFHINSLHAKEVKWLGPAIVLRPGSDHIELTYSVKSASSDGTLMGTLVYEI